MNRSILINTLQQYETPFSEEKVFVQKFLQLLQHRDAFQRHHFPGHITGSAWIIDDSKNFVLLTLHATLNKWLQPGGHADGEENVLNVALREAEEETGLKNFIVFKPGIFDLDIHPIPARNDFPEHLHYDIRFLFQASMQEKLHISEESHDLAWVAVEDIPGMTDNNSSMVRMVEKVLRMT